ncbi:hypothetical protein MLC52_07070 [Sulfurimonas sp. NW15]|uniref:hypothetical protein n=1 Tax=Sulfurimonas sp. NW15 TaxID=2922729 RepID=UPI003DAA26DF
MINITLSNLRNSSNFFDIDDIATIVNGRKKEEIGYFVPKMFKEEFENFMQDLEKKRKLKLLKRVANASKKDTIEDGAVADGIE